MNNLCWLNVWVYLKKMFVILFVNYLKTTLYYGTNVCIRI